MSKIAWAVACVALGASGCATDPYSDCWGSYGEAPVQVFEADGVLAFDWEFGNAYVIDVYEPDGEDGYGDRMWHMQCGGNNNSDGDAYEKQVCIQTPIAYGSEVDSEFFDRVNYTPSRPLKAGQRYRLQIGTYLETDDPTCGEGKFGEVGFVAP